MIINFFKAETKEERAAINTFLTRHNQRGKGSVTGYVAYYAAVWPDDGRNLVDRIVAAAKFCPLHTPQAARFFGSEEWRHVYCLQRLAAYRAPENLLSQFLGWCLKRMGEDPKVHYCATYADTGTFDPRTERPHNGGIYRATNAVYCGLSEGKRVEGFIVDGQRRSMRCGPKTLTMADIPNNARIIRHHPQHRYCWAVGTTLARAFRRRALEKRMTRFEFTAAYQPRLMARLLGWLAWLRRVSAYFSR